MVLPVTLAEQPLPFSQKKVSRSLEKKTGHQIPVTWTPWIMEFGPCWATQCFETAMNPSQSMNLRQKSQNAGKQYHWQKSRTLLVHGKAVCATSVVELLGGPLSTWGPKQCLCCCWWWFLEINSFSYFINVHFFYLNTKIKRF